MYGPALLHVQHKEVCELTVSLLSVQKPICCTCEMMFSCDAVSPNNATDGIVHDMSCVAWRLLNAAATPTPNVVEREGIKLTYASSGHMLQAGAYICHDADVQYCCALICPTLWKGGKKGGGTEHESEAASNAQLLMFVIPWHA